MLNRRHIRIKIMQSIYALLQSKSDDLVREEKFIHFSIDRIYDLYILMLSLLVEVRDLAVLILIKNSSKIDYYLF